MPRTPRPGVVLTGDYGSAVVVEPGTTPLEGLLTLLEESYGGDRFAPDNPAIVAALPSTSIATWFSCTKAYRDEHCDDYTDNWWSEDGDGKRVVTVCFYEGNAYGLGGAADDAESAGVSSVQANPDQP